eukprot:TRINITY_DN5632_c0_g1_i3.p1 TRINITY_DN5632_c0_g1~~TRINITY_DN5632_c0_g1_i3.p1  ORF type:complete len:139 (-),score=15.38 TRINITY_DN5632_c0_g1_i3:67-483(-)
MGEVEGRGGVKMRTRIRSPQLGARGQGRYGSGSHELGAWPVRLRARARGAPRRVGSLWSVAEELFASSALGERRLQRRAWTAGRLAAGAERAAEGRRRLYTVKVLQRDWLSRISASAANGAPVTHGCAGEVKEARVLP